MPAGTVTPARLCTLCGEDKANVSRALKQLEDEGYVTKAPLTERGAEIGGALAREVDRIVSFVSGEISEEEILAMYRTLGKIDVNLSLLQPREDLN